MEELDKIHEAYQNETVENRYRFISKLKKFLATRSDLKSLEHHKLFTSIISHHLDTLNSEKDLLEKFLMARNDLLCDGLNYMPNDALEGYNFLNKNIADRVEELQHEITEYATDLKRRKQLAIDHY